MHAHFLTYAQACGTTIPQFWWDKHVLSLKHVQNERARVEFQ
jgi:hypothetical protein